MKGNRKYIIGFAVVLIIFVLVEVLKPKETDWTVSFSKKDKIPYGTYALFDLMKQTFNEEDFITNSLSFYEFIEENQTLTGSNYIIITNNLEVSPIDVEEMLSFAAKGNNVFIAAQYINNELLDTLQVWADYSFNLHDSTMLAFANKNLNSDTAYAYTKKTEGNYYQILDENGVTILGQSTDSLVNFVKIPFGAGNFYLNSQPFVYTNYNLLKADNYEYAFKSLSYLPKTTTYWDEYYKPGRKMQSSPLRVVFNSKALVVAYYLLLIGLILYMLFMGKRKQRIISILKPFKNTSLEFTQTIAQLYFHKKNHLDLMNKKYKFLLENLDKQYFIKPMDFNIENIDRISEKTNVSHKTLRKLIAQMEAVKQKNRISDSQIFEMNKTIEQFYAEAG